MLSTSNIRRYLVPLAVAVALVAIAVPTCQMIGCSMDMSRPMFGSGMGAGTLFSGQCDGRWVYSAGSAAVTPSGVDSLAFGLFTALTIAVVLCVPTAGGRQWAPARAKAPPPPLDPRGERLII